MDWMAACTKSLTGEAKREGFDRKDRKSWIYVKIVNNERGYRLRQLLNGAKTVRPARIFNKHPSTFNDWIPARYP